MDKNVDLFKPLREIQFVDRDRVKPNSYNPNMVQEKNLKLLMQSILTNGFCFPIVVVRTLQLSTDIIAGLSVDGNR